AACVLQLHRRADLGADRRGRRLPRVVRRRAVDRTSEARADPDRHGIRAGVRHRLVRPAVAATLTPAPRYGFLPAIGSRRDYVVLAALPAFLRLPPRATPA